MKGRYFIVGALGALLLSCSTPTPEQQLAKQILEDKTLQQVDSLARAVVRQGLNAGSGYSQIWARDMNTFIEVACEETTRNTYAMPSSCSSRCNNPTTR